MHSIYKMSDNCFNFSETSEESSFFEEIMKQLDSVKESCNANWISPLEKFREKNEEFSELLEELIGVYSTEINFSFGLFSETVESLLNRVEFCIKELSALATESFEILTKGTVVGQSKISSFNDAYSEAIRNLRNLRQFYDNSIETLTGDTTKLKEKRNFVECVLKALNHNIANYNKKDPPKRIFTEAEAVAASKLKESNVGKKHGLNRLR